MARSGDIVGFGAKFCPLRTEASNWALAHPMKAKQPRIDKNHNIGLNLDVKKFYKITKI